MIYSSLVLGALFLYMVYRPKKQQPTRLKFRTARPLPSVRRHSAAQNSQERELTVLFQFNGHTFEAYEVLGVTPGTDAQTLEKAYQQARVMLPQEELELLDFAYQSIRSKRP